MLSSPTMVTGAAAAPNSLKSRSTKFDPINPALPVTRIRFISFGIAFKSGYNKGHPDIDIFSA